MASGGNLYHDPKTHEWYDTVMVVYDYDTPLGPAKAYYQTQTTNGSQGYFENFMGDQGTLLISESEVNYAGQLYRDPNAPAWDEWVQKGYVSAPKEQETKAEERRGAIADVRESVAPDQHTRAGDAARSVSPAAPAELLRRGARQGEAQLPGRGRLRDRGRRAQGQRGDRGEDAAVVQARRLQGMTGSGDMEDAKLSRSAMIAITVLRVFVGWHFLYEGIAKLTSAVMVGGGIHEERRAGRSRSSSGGSPSQPQPARQREPRSRCTGLTIVGVLLILGLFTRLAASAGIGFILLSISATRRSSATSTRSPPRAAT